MFKLTGNYCSMVLKVPENKSCIVCMHCIYLKFVVIITLVCFKVVVFFCLLDVNIVEFLCFSIENLRKRPDFMTQNTMFH